MYLHLCSILPAPKRGIVVCHKTKEQPDCFMNLNRLCGTGANPLRALGWSCFTETGFGSNASAQGEEAEISVQESTWQRALQRWSYLPLPKCIVFISSLIEARGGGGGSINGPRFSELSLSSPQTVFCCSWLEQVSGPAAKPYSVKWRRNYEKWFGLRDLWSHIHESILVSFHIA